MQDFIQKLLWSRLILASLAIATVAGATQSQAAPGDLYVAANGGNGDVYKFTPDGQRSTVASGLQQPLALAFDRAGNLFVGNSGASTTPAPSTIIKITPDGTKSTFATLQSSQLLGMAFDGAGNLFVSTGGSIIKIAPNGAQTTFASGLNGVWPLAFDRLGNLFAAINPVGPSSILKFAPDGSSSTFVAFSGPGSSVTGLAFGPTGDLFVLRSNAILRVTPDATVTNFATGDFASGCLAFDAAGNPFAGKNAFNTAEPAILKFTPSGEAQTFASGPLSPWSFAFEPVTEKIRNISARGFVATGDNVLIGGFIVGGSALANNAVVVRALGPSMSQQGVADRLNDPVLELHDSSGALIASNNDWEDTQKEQILAAGLAPADSRESAIYATLPAGNYTGVVRSRDQTIGNALVEIYSVNR